MAFLNNVYAINLTMTILVEISGIEPLTYAVQVRRSPKLSYIPIRDIYLVVHPRIEPYITLRFLHFMIEVESCFGSSFSEFFLK